VITRGALTLLDGCDESHPATYPQRSLLEEAMKNSRWEPASPVTSRDGKRLVLSNYQSEHVVGKVLI